MTFGAKLFGLLAAGGLASAPVATARDANRDASDAHSAAEPFADELLLAHNRERANFGSAPLKWSPQLAREAQDWADHLAREGVMRHATHAQRKGRGENLWMGSAGYFSLTEMMSYFIAEKQHFKPGEFPHVSRTGRWRDVGHYTQIVWHETQDVGCAVARGKRDEILVCRYWPAGNTYGRKVG